MVLFYSIYPQLYQIPTNLSIIKLFILIETYARRYYSSIPYPIQFPLNEKHQPIYTDLRNRVSNWCLLKIAHRSVMNLQWKRLFHLPWNNRPPFPSWCSSSLLPLEESNKESIRPFCRRFSREAVVSILLFPSRIGSRSCGEVKLRIFPPEFLRLVSGGWTLFPDLRGNHFVWIQKVVRSRVWESFLFLFWCVRFAFQAYSKVLQSNLFHFPC